MGSNTSTLRDVARRNPDSVKRLRTLCAPCSHLAERCKNLVKRRVSGPAILSGDPTILSGGPSVLSGGPSVLSRAPDSSGGAQNLVKHCLFERSHGEQHVDPSDRHEILHELIPSRKTSIQDSITMLPTCPCKIPSDQLKRCAKHTFSLARS